MVSLMTALWFAHLRGARPRVGQAARLARCCTRSTTCSAGSTARYLTDAARSSAACSPTRRGTKDPDPVDYSTGSVGIGATAPIWGALAHRYVAGHFDVPGRRAPDRADRRRRARRGRVLGGDRRPDGRRASARSLWVVDLNRQSLDRVVPDIAAGRLAAMFEAAGWHVVMVKYGAARSCARPARALRARIDAMPNEEYQRLLRADARRAARAAAAGDGAMARALADLDDARAARHVPRPRRPRPRRADRRLPPGRRGARPPDRRLRLHDQGLAAARPRATRPTTPRCSTSRAVRASSPPRSATDPDDPWRALRRRQRRGRAVRARRRARLRARRSARARAAAPCPPTLGREHTGRDSTQQAFGRFFVDLVREAPEVADARRHRLARRRHLDQPRRLDQQGRHLVASATGSTGSPTTPTRSCAGARTTTAGTSSSGSPRSTSSACSASSARRGRATAQPLLPVGTIYDPFVARALEPWSFGIYAGGQSILVGTPTGVTLGPEGGAHQSVITPVDRHRAARLRRLGAGLRPGPRVDASCTRCRGSAARTGRRPTSGSRRGPLDQALAGPATRARARRRDVLAGGYRLRDRARGAAGRRSPRWARSCPRRSPRRTARASSARAEVVCITSRRPALPRVPGPRRARRRRRRDPRPALPPGAAPLVTLLDGHPHTLASSAPSRRADHLPRRPRLRPVRRHRRALRAPRDRRRVDRRRRARPRGLARGAARAPWPSRAGRRPARASWRARRSRRAVTRRGGRSARWGGPA